MKYKKIIYLVYFIPIVVLSYLFYQNIKPVLELEYDIKGKSAMFSQLVPLSRVGELKQDEFGYYREIKEEPAYFDIRMPRKYNKAQVEIEYEDLNNDIFEIGVSRDEARKNFDFITLENKILDKLEWNKIEQGGLVLYQRNLKYETMDDFFKNPPGFFETLIYRADATPKLGSFWARGGRSFNFPILEHIKFAFYHNGGEINFELPGFEARIYKDGAQIDFTKEKDLKPGVYIMELTGDRGSVIENLGLDTPYVAILDGIKIGKLKYPITLYSAGSRILTKTEKKSGVQELWIGGEKLKIDEPFLQYKAISANRGVKSIYISKGDVELSGNLFFLKPNNLFYPRYEVMYPGIDLSGVNYILSKYNTPKNENGLKVAHAEFDIKNTPTPYNKLRFLLSLPNGESSEGLVKIRSIKLRFTGEKYSFAEIFERIKKTLTAKR